MTGVRQLARRVAPGIGSGLLDRLPPVRRHLRGGLHVFTFHNVTDTPSPNQEEHQLATSRGVFRSQLDWIERRFEVVHPDGLCGSTTSLRDGSAVLTFDDGWEGIFTNALPELERRGLPSVVFLNMAAVLGEPDLTSIATWRAKVHGGAVEWPRSATFRLDELPSSTADREELQHYQGPVATTEDLARWAGHPLVRFGSHLFRHWDVSGLDDDELRRELRANADALGQFDGVVPLFAFPFGKRGVHFSRHQAEVVLAEGAVRVFSSDAVANALPASTVLDRVSLTPRHRTDRDCWWATHGLDLVAWLRQRRPT